jgi:NAD(P)-dependent dehydrogenase (short-subunit alcohol dehydrogenase family)
MKNTKRVFITGASAGFGQDTTKAMAEKGHTVYATMRGATGKNADKARALQSWAKERGHSVHVLDLDVTQDQSVDKAVTAALQNGGIDVLINNAGLGNWGIDEGFTIEQAQQVFDINLFGVMRVNRAVLPYFRREGKGLILYVSSGLGRIVFPFLAVYTASKHALEGYAESTSYELAPLGIRSVIVQPGAYGTTFLANSMPPQSDVTGAYGPTAKMFEAFGSGFEERAKSGELGDPSEVVQALVEEVERPDGERPLRRTVGQDVLEPVSAINQTCDQVQGHLLDALGLK